MNITYGLELVGNYCLSVFVGKLPMPVLHTNFFHE